MFIFPLPSSGAVRTTTIATCVMLVFFFNSETKLASRNVLSTKLEFSYT